MAQITDKLSVFCGELILTTKFVQSPHKKDLTAQCPEITPQGHNHTRPVEYVCPSVRPSRLPCPLCNIYSSGWVVSILATKITTMRGCVAHNDLWPWPISSRSFGLDLENRVRSVASTVMHGFFLYLAQMITIIRGCVACYVFFKIWKFEFLANF